jgi:hypothetical protein
MRGNYHGLPPAASVEQAIILAQLLIANDLARRITKKQASGDHAAYPQGPEDDQD